MVKHVVKRDGRVVIFDNRKIVDAILKAMNVTEEGEDIVLAAEIASAISKINVDNMSVEDIQDQVENELMNSPRKEVAKKYIAYRNQRNLARKAKSREIFQEIIDAQATEITRENANMNADTPAGMMMKFASESTKSYVDECLLSEDVKEAVKNNYIHIHDKDYYPTKSLTCIQHPLDKILEDGFFAGHGESRPAKRIETASILGCISLETVQNEMHGGQAIPAFDFYMAPFVRKTFQEELDKIGEINGENYVFELKILLVLILVDECRLKLSLLAYIELLDLDLLGKDHTVLRHPLEDGLLGTPVDRELLVSLLLFEIVDLILRESLLLHNGKVPFKRLDVDAELVIIADDDRNIFVGMGDADVRHAVLEVRLSVVMVVQVHLLLEHFVQECAHGKLLPSVALVSVKRNLFKFICRYGHEVQQLLFAFRHLPYGDLRLVFKSLS